MQSTKTLIFQVQNILFKALTSIFKDEIKIYKILKESVQNYILIEEAKEEIASSRVKKFSFSLKISTTFFEEEKLASILEKLYLLEEILKEDFINAKIISTQVQTPTAFKGFEARVLIFLYA